MIPSFQIKQIFSHRCCFSTRQGFSLDDTPSHLNLREMGLPAETCVPSVTPQLVGNAFVEQYYKILHGSPEMFYRLYLDGSTLSRPDSNGTMTSVSTPQGINDFILSLDCKNYIIEILTTDSQPSHKGGVFIQVTGCMIGLDNIRRRFSQSFFLVLQDCGVYFVLNDVFRFVDDCQPAEADQMLANRVSDSQIAPLTPEYVQNLLATDPLTPLSDRNHHDIKEHCDVTENGGSLVEEENTVDQLAQQSHIERGRVINVFEANRVSDSQIAPLTPEQVQILLATGPLTPLSDRNHHDIKEHCDYTENGGSLVEEEDTVDQPAQQSHIERGRVINVFEANRVSDSQIAPLTPEQVQNLLATGPLTPLSDRNHHDIKERCDVTENGGSLVKEDDTVDQPAQQSHSKKGRVVKVFETVEQKKSYASILAKGSSSPMPAHVPSTKSRSTSACQEKPPLPPTTRAHAHEITSSRSNGTSDANHVHKEEGYSVFIRNLPLHATASQVEEVFKKFGPIKPQGVQVRSHQGHNCFGFVEFESLDSRQAAVEASLVMIDGRQVYISEKKMTNRVNGVVSTESNGNGSRGHNFGSSGGSSRNDHFRGGRGSFAGNQGGFARNEFRISRGGGDYPGHGRGPTQGWVPRGRPSEEVYRPPRSAQNGSAVPGGPNSTD